MGVPLRSLTLDRYARQRSSADERSGLPIQDDALKGVKAQRRCNEIVTFWKRAQNLFLGKSIFHFSMLYIQSFVYGHGKKKKVYQAVVL
ncbi:MAG: hypothetical protein IJ494_05610 [Bacteroides sp.]|nr:hypothetical protein [Bacteroides sp.]